VINANFSKEAWDSVQEMLYAETQAAQLEGTCGQKKKREAMKQNRTPAQEQADKQRAQQQQGRDTISSAVRSEAAKKAAETRKRCRGGAAGPATPKPPG
jgi:hypothetical protein